MKYLLFLLLLLTSCASHKVIHQEDVTAKAGWLESTKDNPIINVIQKHYANDDVEIIIKKKLTTDYVKVRLSTKGKVISKKTIKN
jgi:fructose 1,6-bisphosphatase